MLKLIEREKARTDRTGCEFSLVTFRAAAAGADAAPPEWLVSAVRRRARLSDEVEVFSDCVCALLIATPKEGAHHFAESVVASVGAAVRFEVYAYPSERLPPVAGREYGGGHQNGNGTRGGDGEAGQTRGEHRPRHNGTAPKEAAAMAGLVSRCSAGSPQDQIAADLPPEFEALEPLPWWKRSADVVGATILLVALSPFLVIIAALIKIDSRGPVIFRQVRAGRQGHSFQLYKFRSMRVDAEASQDQLRAMNEQDGPAFKIKADPRITRLGRFLRSTSLDELPQLWNVLRGDMSLVGPRPLPWKEACGCELWQRRRLDVLPGMTCIWQVKGRSRVSFADWMRMDMLYIRKRSFMMDLLLLAATIPAVLFRRGV
jgi:lipopolysaccharide/colanic/teichoic acid biosynthesis glycosyltransferase